MKAANDAVDSPDESSHTQTEFDALLTAAVSAGAFAGVIVGQLVAVTEDHVPLVLFPGQRGGAALAARSIVDVHAPHIGKQVALLFEGANPAKPLIIGVVRGDAGLSPSETDSSHVEMSSDGERLLVTAKEQLVLRCGKASITLTKAGKVLIQGTYVSNRSSGVFRLKGGSVQIN
jgi:hypothetical protein